MMTLAVFFRYEIECTLAALAAIVVYQMITGRITTRGLLNEKTANGLGRFSPARLQLLLSTLAAASYIFSEVANSIADTTHGPPRFPDIDPTWLFALAGSHSVFLASKGVAMFRQIQDFSTDNKSGGD